MQGLDTCHPGHGDVCDNEVERALGCEIFNQLSAIRRSSYVDAQLHESVTDHFEQLGIVIRNQDSHARSHADVVSKG
ncbi:MAG TPA: hypothetical protein VGF24_29225 [Vicinamibacterales bacterium]